MSCKTYQIGVCGDKKVGKTSFINFLRFGEHDPCSRFVESDLEFKSNKGGISVRFIECSIFNTHAHA